MARRGRWFVIGVGALVLAAAGAAWASDVGVAKSLVVTKADVGSGYTSAASTSNGDTFAQIASCVGKPVPGRVKSATVDGSAFTDAKTSAVVNSSVDVVQTAAMAQADRAVITDTNLPACLTQLARSQFTGQNVTGAITTPVSVKKYGDFSIAFETQITVAASNQTLTGTIVDVFIQKGRAEVQVAFITENTQPFDQAKGLAILDKLNARIKKAKI